MNCKYKSSMTKKKAFTLIELLIVIAIIGILFIVLVSKVDFATDKAKASGVQTDFRSFQVALEMVSKENAGFNTFGWDTGDNAGAAPSGYTYTNATKDAGDRIRNSYDEGDTNLNGTYDDGEVWTGRKIYTENWTGCYTLINPGNSSDMSAIFDLETAINKNLDPKLHIVIADDGTISMANGYQDPWSTQYHGQYITNASADAAAKWNTDASMAGSTGDNMDRGAILMYSNGANQKFGTKVKIVGGVVTATVSQIDADHLDNNKMGADDYVLAVVYTYTNGYGETAAITEGFSNDQVFLTGNGGTVNNSGTNNVPLTYNISSTTQSQWNYATKAVFYINADINNLEKVIVNNVDLVKNVDYIATEGSTIITLTDAFVSTLTENSNKIVVKFTNGSIETAFYRPGFNNCVHNNVYEQDMALCINEKYHWINVHCTDCDNDFYNGEIGTHYGDGGFCYTCNSSIHEEYCVNNGTKIEEHYESFNKNQHKEVITCDNCGCVSDIIDDHNFANGICTKCEFVCTHDSYVNEKCEYCQLMCSHNNDWGGSWDSVDDYYHFMSWGCNDCNASIYRDEPHVFVNGICLVCGSHCSHEWGNAVVNGVCSICNQSE